MLHITFIAGTYQPDRCGVAHYTARLREVLHHRKVASTVLTTQAAAQAVDTPDVLGVVDDWRLADLWPLAQAIRSRPTDILHIQHAAGTYGFQRAIFLLPLLLRVIGYRAPIVTTVHEYGWWEWQPPGIPLPIVEWFKQVGQRRGWWDREDGWLLTGSQAIITTNTEAETILRSRLPYLTDRLSRIPIGVNVEAVDLEITSRQLVRSQIRQQYGWPEDAIVIAFFGFLHPVKGLETLLTAFKPVLEAHPQARLLLIGGVTSLALPEAEAQRYWNRLEAQIATLNLADRVRMTGYVEAAIASRYLAAADMGVLPFNHGVTLKSGSLLTLLAHQLPVIATQPPQPDPELCEAVLTIPPRHPAALTTALLKLLEDADRRDRLARGGHAFGQGFDWSTIAQRHLETYQRTLQMHPANACEKPNFDTLNMSDPE